LRSHAAETASPSAAAPNPPSAWCVHSTQSSAPAASAASLMTTMSKTKGQSRVSGVYWTMYGQTVRAIGLNSHQR
jgi:hypothetical protein